MEAIKAIQELIKENENSATEIVRLKARVRELEDKQYEWYKKKEDIMKLAYRGDDQPQESQIACKSIYMLVK